MRRDSDKGLNPGLDLGSSPDRSDALLAARVATSADVDQNLADGAVLHGIMRVRRSLERKAVEWKPDVLSDFEPEDDAGALVGRAADAVEALLRDGLEESQRRFN
jgi:hypothetical protein